MSQSLVVVTGASGFVASHVVNALLNEGYKVRATVRNAKDENKVRHLKELGPGSGHEVEIVEADLLEPDSWEKAVEGCTFVMHVASPFPLASPKNPDVLIKPAVDGTLNVLRACEKAGTVKRVVLTSSGAAIAADDREEPFTEKDWVDANRSDITAYYKSKVLAERAAWNFVEQLPENSKFELAVVNPVLVLGPIHHGTSGSSTDIIKMLMNRETPMVPKFAFGIIDVRDVALAHVRCMTVPEAAGNRHILYSDTVWLPEAAATLDKEFRPQGYNIPTRTVPSFMLAVGSVFSRDLRISRKLASRPKKMDSSRMRNVLGIQPRDPSSTIVDMAYSMVDNGFVKKTAEYKGRV